MDPMNNPFRTQMYTYGERVIAANKQLADWQLGQVKLAEKQAASFFEMTRAGMEATVSASHAMGRTLLDATFPAPAESK